jgi:hypothetical protein
MNAPLDESDSLEVLCTQALYQQTLLKQLARTIPQDRELCVFATLREPARRTTAIYDDVLEPSRLKLTQYAKACE